MVQAVFSYSRLDWNANKDVIAAILEELEAQIQSEYGSRDFVIWRDETDLVWGDEWREKLYEALRQSEFLIVLLSPGWLKSEVCRKELAIFMEHEADLGANNRIFVAKFVNIREDDPSITEEMWSIRNFLKKRQMTDWSPLRTATADQRRTEILKAAEDVASRMVARLKPPVPAPTVPLVTVKVDGPNSGNAIPPQPPKPPTRRDEFPEQPIAPGRSEPKVGGAGDPAQTSRNGPVAESNLHSARPAKPQTTTVEQPPKRAPSHHWSKVMTPLITLKGHQHVVDSVAFSPKSQRLATGSADRTARVWVIADGVSEDKDETPERDATPGVFWAAIRTVWPFSNHRSNSDNRSNSDLRSKRELLRLEGHGGKVYSVAFSPDDQRLATGSGDTTARVWDLATGQELLRLEGHGGDVNSVAFSPDGQRLATGSDDNTARIWDLATGQELLRLEGHEHWVTSVAFSPDSRRLATGSTDHTARVWDLASGQELRRLEGHWGTVNSVAFSPDGKRLATASGSETLFRKSDDTARVWDLSTGQEVLRFEGDGHRVLSVAFSRDGQRLATGSEYKTVRVWDLASGKELLRLEGHGDWVRSVAFSPDGQRLATGSSDNTAEVLQIPTGGDGGHH